MHAPCNSELPKHAGPLPELPRLELGTECSFTQTACSSLSRPAQGAALPEGAAAGEITVPVDTLAGAPLTAVATAQGVSLRDQDARTADAKVLRAQRVCQAVLNAVDAVPLPF
jgi:hypothetical protein